MERGYPAAKILNDILERYKTEMLDSSASLSVAIYEFYSENQPDTKDNMLYQQYLSSKNVGKFYRLWNRTR